MIRFTDVHFAYHAASADPVLSGVDLALEAGEYVAVLGANGSGKSTLVRLANGLLWPVSGCVEVDGVDTREHTRLREVRERVGVVFQRPDDQIVATTVEDDVAFGPENLGLAPAEIRERVGQALAVVELTGLERREPHTLSGGQKQRLAIAGVLAMRPAYLVLDEPASMLDPVARLEVLEIAEKLAAAGTGVLHVTQDLADVVRADRAIVLAEGRVAYQGSVAGLLGEEETLAVCGLEAPPISRVVARLRAGGIDVDPLVADADGLAEALWA
jgi:energy-coupling factor transport system ATP-binding protein